MTTYVDIRLDKTIMDWVHIHKNLSVTYQCAQRLLLTANQSRMETESDTVDGDRVRTVQCRAVSKNPFPDSKTLDFCLNCDFTYPSDDCESSNEKKYD